MSSERKSSSSGSSDPRSSYRQARSTSPRKAYGRRKSVELDASRNLDDRFAKEEERRVKKARASKARERTKKQQSSSKDRKKRRSATREKGTAQPPRSVRRSQTSPTSSRSSANSASPRKSASQRVVTDPKRTTSRSGDTRTATGSGKQIAHQEYERKLNPSRTERSNRTAKVKATERERKQKVSRRNFYIKIAVSVVLIGLLVVGVYAVYQSDFLSIKQVTVTGNHVLSREDVLQKGGVPASTTMFRVPIKSIESSLVADPWVASVDISRKWPSTLAIAVHERQPIASVTTQEMKDGWLLSEDGHWLEPTSKESTKTVMALEGPLGIKPEAGTEERDPALRNAIEIVKKMDPELRKSIVRINTQSVEKTELVTKDGVLIYFGSAEMLPEKEKVISELLKEHAGNIVYINVRVPENPTWRGK